MALDPDDKQTVGTWQPGRPIDHPGFWDFGRFPNTDDWLPGDLILVSHIKPGFMQRRIIRAQKARGYNDHSKWHHVACYLGDEDICEALLTGVKRDHISKYVGRHHIKVMRDATLSDKERNALTGWMLTRSGDSYSFTEIGKQILASAGRLFHPRRPPRVESSGACICSGVYCDAYAAATGRLLVRLTTNAVKPCPADLSLAGLKEVDTRWRRIVTRAAEVPPTPF